MMAFALLADIVPVAELVPGTFVVVAAPPTRPAHSAGPLAHRLHPVDMAVVGPVGT